MHFAMVHFRINNAKSSVGWFFCLIIECNFLSDNLLNRPLISYNESSFTFPNYVQNFDFHERKNWIRRSHFISNKYCFCRYLFQNIPHNDNKRNVMSSIFMGGPLSLVLPNWNFTWSGCMTCYVAKLKLLSL